MTTSGTPLVVAATELSGAEGGLAVAAAVSGSLARLGRDSPLGVILIELDAPTRRRPTLVSSHAARTLEERLRGGVRASARGAVCWVQVEPGGDAEAALDLCLGVGADAVVLHAEQARWRQLVEARGIEAVVVRADALGEHRSLTALLASDLIAAGVRTGVVSRAPGLVASRRAMAGIDPGGGLGERAGRIATRLASQGGQAMPLMLGMALIAVLAGTVLAVMSASATGAERLQRAADLGAVSAARSMRDDYPRLFVPPTLPNGLPNPAHLSEQEYRSRAGGAAREAISRNGVASDEVDVTFPAGLAPTRVEVVVGAEAELDRRATGADLEATATAETYPVTTAVSASTATGEGDYTGPLATRQGEQMRPDVAQAFDAMAAAASRAGIGLVINSGYRSDAEQAALFAANPDPRMVARPGTSLHRCGTELDLGPSSAYGWLAANAGRFGFLQRYSWEAWHYGFTQGPAPCAKGSGSTGDGAQAGASLPSFVPERYRGAVTSAASRWNVPAALLAAQLMAESGFNPGAVSPAGAQGIAQFMPGTAAAYGLGNPFDAQAAINAQANLMSDLLRQFGGATELALAAYNAGPAPVAACNCVPSYPETQAYVARILGLLGGVGVIAPPALEVRLVG